MAKITSRNFSMTPNFCKFCFNENINRFCIWSLTFKGYCQCSNILRILKKMLKNAFLHFEAFNGLYGLLNLVQRLHHIIQMCDILLRLLSFGILKTINFSANFSSDFFSGMKLVRNYPIVELKCQVSWALEQSYSTFSA